MNPGAAIGGIAVRALILVFAAVPRRLCLALGAGAGSLAYALDRRRRRIALGNLRLAFGGSLSPTAARRIARASFRHFGRVTADVLKLSSLSDERIAGLLDVEGAEHLTRALAAGRGALLVTGHFGNWEIAARAVSRLGPLNVIARRLDSSVLDRELNRLRARLGARVIDKRAAARRALQVLRANEVLAILIDQNVLRSEGVFVDFFGRPASTTPAAAAFHLRTGAPILPIFCFPAPRGRYRVEIRPPLAPPPDVPGGRPNVLQITALSTKMLAAEIRRRPDLWLWFHDRWRSRPSQHNKEDAA